MGGWPRGPCCPGLCCLRWALPPPCCGRVPAVEAVAWEPESQAAALLLAASVPTLFLQMGFRAASPLGDERAEGLSSTWPRVAVRSAPEEGLKSAFIVSAASPKSEVSWG